MNGEWLLLPIAIILIVVGAAVRDRELRKLFWYSAIGFLLVDAFINIESFFRGLQ